MYNPHRCSHHLLHTERRNAEMLKRQREEREERQKELRLKREKERGKEREKELEREKEREMELKKRSEANELKERVSMGFGRLVSNGCNMGFVQLSFKCFFVRIIRCEMSTISFPFEIMTQP